MSAIVKKRFFLFLKELVMSIIRNSKLKGIKSEISIKVKTKIFIKAINEPRYP
jgi:hypothetical protein